MWKHMAPRQLGIYTQQYAIKMVMDLKKKKICISFLFCLIAAGHEAVVNS